MSSHERVTSPERQWRGLGQPPAEVTWPPLRACAGAGGMMAAVMNVTRRAAADLRLLRAAVFSAVCVVVSAGGHELASGAGISVGVLLLAWAGTMCVAVPLAGRERGLPGIGLCLLGGELALHALFCLGQSRMGPVPATAASTRVVALAGRLLCGEPPRRLGPAAAEQILHRAGIGPASAATGMPGMSGMASHDAHAMSMSLVPGPAMLAAHLVAALVLGWALRRGEAAVWGVIKLSPQGVRSLVVLLVEGVLATVRVLRLLAGLTGGQLHVAGRRWAEAGAGQPEPVELRHSVIRRGPPGADCAA